MRVAPVLALIAGFSLLLVGAPLPHARPVGSEKQALLSLLPKETEVPGLKARSAPEFYEPGNLFDYMNGQADAYLDYGFKLLMACEYDAGADSRFTLEIYRMESPRHAFGIGAAERTLEDKDLELGAKGFQGANIFGFWKGHHYCKIIFYKTSPELESIIWKTGRLLADRIPGSSSIPDLFNVFPVEHRVKGSERFIPKNFLGQSYIRNGYRADFVREGRGYQVFLLETASTEEARDSYMRYQEFLRAERETVAPSKTVGFDMVRVQSDRDKFLFHFGSYWGGVLDEKDPGAAEQLIRTMVERLKARVR